MTPASTDFMRSNNITQENINTMMKYPLKEKINGDAGVGTFRYFYNSFSTDKRIEFKNRKRK